MARGQRGFVGLHPAVALSYLVVVVVLSVMMDNLGFQALGLLGAMALYIYEQGERAWRTFGFLALAFALITLVNPLFNAQGDTVLFSWLGGRPFTLEALVCGLSAATLFISVLLWFLGLSSALSPEALTYLFGRIAPTFTLLLVMVVAMIPRFRQQGKRIMEAREGIGQSPSRGPLGKRVASGSTFLATLTSSSLEGSVVAADSMASRGYGTGRRSVFADYRFTARDGVVLGVMAVALVLTLGGFLSGATSMEFFPRLGWPTLTPVGIVGLGGFALYGLIPTFVDIWEDASWRISLSRI